MVTVFHRFSPHGSWSGAIPRRPPGQTPVRDRSPARSGTGRVTPDTAAGHPPAEGVDPARRAATSSTNRSSATPSGSRLTEGSVRRPPSRHAGDARKDRDRADRQGPCPSGGGRGGPEQPAEARLAGEDRPGHGGRPRPPPGHSPRRAKETGRPAPA